MAFGILECNGTLEQVPGTAQLEVLPSKRMTHLKKGKGGDSHIVLIPQPSDDPNDPLNWPLWQRDSILLLYCFCTLMCVGGVGPLLAVITFPILQEFHLTFTQVSLLTGYQLATVGAVVIFTSAVCTKYGKRGPFLISMALLFSGTIWCAASTSYDTLLGARIIQGLGAAVFEAITFALVGDLYHVHQRGSRMAFFVVSQSGLLLLPSLIAGQIGEHMNWRWVFWLLAIFLAVGFIGLLFLGWETTYKRNKIVSSLPNTTTTNELEDNKSTHFGATHVENTELESKDPEQFSATSPIAQSRDSFKKRLRPFSGIYAEESILRLSLRPFYIMANPIIVWSMILIAFSQLWNVLINLLIAQIFAVPPYNLNTAQIGYILVGPMIGGLLGCLLCGLTSDPICRAISKRNNGTYEPEFRLWIMATVPIFCSLGYFTFGNLAERGESPVVMSVIWGIAFVSVQVVTSSIGSYVVDAFPESTIEVFIVTTSIKNFVFFAFSFFMNNWLAEWGAARTFNTIGGIMLAMSATVIPVYVYGKRSRAWWHAKVVLRKS
ncbi:MFS general substrate transporter [Melanomma pulvis-pyrius CBS 109.77]|uniref:MFS general substrate transporter n=1 Tax=Melanomma pulvis-pyrius CBS 109.77 TaxID=1314802 RepID=A0A6A6XJI9_9PLEO|nr:MFS general substrate transporter [Melanomma pulvis-pyrius CBS 109.77]